MSRSRRKTLHHGNAGRMSEKVWKTKNNRSYRRKTNQQIREGETDIPCPTPNGYGPKDGKFWMGRLLKEVVTKLMRK